MTSSPAPVAAFRPPRAMAIWWAVAGFAGWTVSFLLYHEYIGQLTGGDALISCNISPVVTCGPKGLDPGSWTRCHFGYAASVRVADLAAA